MIARIESGAQARISVSQRSTASSSEARGTSGRLAHTSRRGQSKALEDQNKVLQESAKSLQDETKSLREKVTTFETVLARPGFGAENAKDRETALSQKRNKLFNEFARQPGQAHFDTFLDSKSASDPEIKDRKYVNSPESPLFHKKESLYGLHAALDAIRRSGTAIVVEGNFDVIASSAQAFENSLELTAKVAFDFKNNPR